MFQLFKREDGFYKGLLALAAPMMLQNLLQQFLGLFDTFMVGTLGEMELSAVSLANTPFFIISLVIFGLESGAMILISQYWGKKDLTTISRVLGIGGGMALGVALLFGVAMTAMPEKIMGIITSDRGLVEIAARYGRVVAFAPFFNCFALIYGGGQRAMENPKFGMRVMGISVITNTFFNWVLIFGQFGLPAMGVEGAALGTLLARIVEMCITVVFAARNSHFRLNVRAMLRPGVALFKDYIRYASPVILNETIWGLGSSMHSIIIGHMPSAAVSMAAYTVAGNVERILGVVQFGIGASASVMVGKSIGAGESPKKVYSLGKLLSYLSVAAGIVAGILLFTLNITVIRGFVYNLIQLSEEAQGYAFFMVNIASVMLPMRAFNFCNIVGILRGGGDTKAAMFIDILPLWLLAVPLSALFGLVLGGNVVMVYSAICVDEICKFIGGILRFRQKKWIRNLTRDWD